MELETSYKIDTDLVMTPDELKQIYLFGVNMTLNGGNTLDDDTIRFYIKAAMDEIETHFNLKLIRQIIEETRDYNLSDYQNFGYLRLSYPVVKAYSLIGKFGEAEQIKYPKEWLSSKKSNENPEMYYRNLYLLPNIGGTTQTGGAGVTFNGIFGANLLWKSRQYISNYWHARYLTGFKKIPGDLLNVLGMLAAINVFNICGDIILGAGIASYSLSLDGLSQSISSTSSATNSGYGSRIISYFDSIKRILPVLEARYRGFAVSAL